MRHFFANKVGVSVEVKVFSNRVYMMMPDMIKQAFKVSLEKKNIIVDDKFGWLCFEIKDVTEEVKVFEEILKDFKDGGFEINVIQWRSVWKAIKQNNG